MGGGWGVGEANADGLVGWFVVCDSLFWRGREGGKEGGVEGVIVVLGTRSEVVMGT